MPSIGPAELILVLILALLVFGPSKLPEVGRTIGRSLREFRRASSGIREEFERDLDLEADLDVEDDLDVDDDDEPPVPSKAPSKGPGPEASS